jgi:hypothetical protein
MAVTTETGVQTEAITSRKASCRAPGWLGARLVVIGDLRVRLCGRHAGLKNAKKYSGSVIM